MECDRSVTFSRGRCRDASFLRDQSARAKALHHPFGLTWPSITLQDWGGSNSVQVAHILIPFGASRYSACSFVILSNASPFDADPSVKLAATLASADWTTLRRGMPSPTLAVSPAMEPRLMTTPGLHGSTVATHINSTEVTNRGTGTSALFSKS